MIFRKIFNSSEFSEFIKNMMYYIRAYIRCHLSAAQDHAQRAWQDVPPSLLRHISELNKFENLQTDKENLNYYKVHSKY